LDLFHQAISLQGQKRETQKGQEPEGQKPLPPPTPELPHGQEAHGYQGGGVEEGSQGRKPQGRNCPPPPHLLPGEEEKGQSEARPQGVHAVGEEERGNVEEEKEPPLQGIASRKEKGEEEAEKDPHAPDRPNGGAREPQERAGQGIKARFEPCGEARAKGVP
jgi:hypothetical protein